jgi:hypothetical protein
MATHANFSAWSLVLQSCLLLLAGVIARFCVTLYRVRHRFQLMQKAGLVSLYNTNLFSFDSPGIP